MSVTNNSWRCSLVATALWTILGGSPAHVAADDQPEKTPSSAVDRDKAERYRSMKEKIMQLEQDGKHEEAQKLLREFRESMAKPNGGAAVSGPDTGMIRVRIQEMAEKAEQLDKDGKHEDASRVRSEIKAIYSKLSQHAGTTETSTSPERKELYQRMHALQEQIENAKRVGRSEEVQGLMKEMEAVHSKLYALSGHNPVYTTSGGDREARLKHLRAAAENLKAAGCELETQHVMQMIERIQAEAAAEARHRSETSVTWTALQPPNSPPPPLEPVVKELRGEVEQLHREMRELREELNRVIKSSDR
jgi:hypothetical protein